jgi:hypothetical protein
MTSYRYKVRILLPSLLLLLLPLTLSAQDEGEKGAEPGGIPTYTGKGKITQAIDTDKGAVFDIGGGFTMLFPKGLPVGHSRIVTLKFGSKRPKPSQIHKKFKPHGKTLLLDAALNARRTPLVLAMSVKKEPMKKGYKLVLAVEEAGFCEPKNKKYKIGKSGLCSTWRTIDAEYDSAQKRVVAELESTGGLRLQLGWIPLSDE